MKRSKFSLSHSKLLTCDLGELVPVGLMEVLPGDSIQLSTAALLRCQALLAPVMHPVSVRIHHWFVPHRLVMDDFESFITGGPDGMDATVWPTITFPTGVLAGSLADYLGVPPTGASITVSALPLRGYARIFNEWYRDQDLQTPLVISTASGPDTTTSTALQNIGWEKDYFSSARPWEQKGPQVSIPLVGNAPVTGIGWANVSATVGTSPTLRDTKLGTSTYAPSYWQLSSGSGGVGGPFYMKGATASGSTMPDVKADLSGVSAVTVNSLRQALAIQRFEEARARYGSRYSEYLLSLGIRSSDARLQRPEYLGGGRQTIQFSEVLQTAEGENPVGEMRGHGIAALRSNRFRRFFEEHGYVFTLLSVRPKSIYANGLFRHWNRRTKTDFWQRELQHIGQQPILNKEVYGAHATPEGTFGYQDRYDEYRRMESSIAGDFRNTLDFWHFARIFATSPALNSSFVSCVPAERPFAVPSEDVLLINARHNCQARRLVASTGASFIF
ncbi:putative VP1 [Microviridae sp.]|nr:putative VP1 [Microviridae sp.]